jgi:hypothetical protein
MMNDEVQSFIFSVLLCKRLSVFDAQVQSKMSKSVYAQMQRAIVSRRQDLLFYKTQVADATRSLLVFDLHVSMMVR